MNDINFIKKASYKNKSKYNKYFFSFFLFLIIVLFLINIFQLYKIYISTTIYKDLYKKVETLDTIAQENNKIKDEIKTIQNKKENFESIIRSNNNLLSFLLSVSKYIPKDSYLENFSFDNNIKNSEVDRNDINVNTEKFKELKIVNLKGFSTSKSIIEFIEKLSRLETVDNVKLDYLKYNENNNMLLEFSVKLFLNNS